MEMVFGDMPFLIGDVVQDKEADSPDDDKRHYCDIDSRVT